MLLFNDAGEVVLVVVALTWFERAEDGSSPPAFSSCVQATLGVGEKQRELLSISLSTSFDRQWPILNDIIRGSLWHDRFDNVAFSLIIIVSVCV